MDSEIPDPITLRWLAEQLNELHRSVREIRQEIAAMTERLRRHAEILDRLAQP